MLGADWEHFVEAYEKCVQIIGDQERTHSAWQGQRASDSLIAAMEPWLEGRPFQMEKDVEKLPDNFLALWTTHWHQRLCFKVSENSQPATVRSHLSRKGFMKPGRQGLVVLAVGLYWSWWVAKSEAHTGTLAQWLTLVKSVTAVLSKYAQ